MKALAVRGVGLWLRGYPSAEAWLAGSPDPAAREPAGRLLPATIRRRSSPFTRANADAYAQALAQAGIDQDAPLRMVFAAAFGEMYATCALLTELNEGDGKLSPIHFSSCVHNTAAGKIAIATRNRSNANSVAAGPDSVEAGLWEAGALLAEAPESIVAVFGDAASDERFVAAAAMYDTLTVAFVLARPAADEPALGTISLPTREVSAEPWPGRIPDAVAGNPCVGALRLADSVLRGRAGAVPLAPRPDEGAWTRFAPPEGP